AVSDLLGGSVPPVNRRDYQLKGVVGVAAEGGGFFAVQLFILHVVVLEQLRLGVRLGKGIVDRHFAGRVYHPISGLTGQFNVYSGSRAVAHVKRDLDVELLDVFRDDGHPGVQGPGYNCIRLDAPDFGQLWGHVIVFGGEHFVCHDGKTLLCRICLKLLEAGGAEPVRNREEGDPFLIFAVHVTEELLDCNMVAGGGLEHPVLDRIYDLATCRARNHGDLRLLDQGDDRHAFAGSGRADDNIYLVVLDQPGGQLDRLGGITSGVVDNGLN